MAKSSSNRGVRMHGRRGSQRNDVPSVPDSDRAPWWLKIIVGVGLFIIMLALHTKFIEWGR